MMRGPISLRFLAYGLLGVVLEVSFTRLHALLVGLGSRPEPTSLWMLGIYGAGGLVLEGADELLRLPTALRAVGLVLCIYALGTFGGWAFQETGAECPWASAAAGGVGSMGSLRLDYAPYWFVLALGFRWIRRGLDAVQTVLASLPREKQAQPGDALLEGASWSR